MAYGKWKDLDHVERYAKKRYRNWDQRWINHRELRIVSTLFEEYNISGTVLDLPVGYGRFQTVLNRFGETIASDLGYMPLLYQQERMGIAIGSVNADAVSLPLKDNSVDVVFCIRLFQHMHLRKERTAILREFKRVGRKWIIVSLYITTPLHGLHRAVVKKPSRITMLSKNELNSELSESALSLKTMKGIVPGLHAHRICLLSCQ